MSMMDLASALQGGGGGQPDPSGGLPPNAPDPSGGYGGDPTADPTQDPSQAPPATTGPGGDQYSNSLEALDAAESALQAFIALDPDHGDRAIAAQCLQNVIKLKASNQQSSQSGDMKSLQRALLGGPGATAGPIGQAIGGGGSGGQ